MRDEDSSNVVEFPKLDPYPAHDSLLLVSDGIMLLELEDTDLVLDVAPESVAHSIKVLEDVLTALRSLHGRKPANDVLH